MVTFNAFACSYTDCDNCMALNRPLQFVCESLMCECMQGAEVLGPVPAPFLAPAKPKHLPPAVAPVAAMPDTPLSFLIKGITNFAEQASAAANANSASGANPGRKLQQQPAQPGQALPAYKNPPALIQVDPDLIVDQKNRKAFLKGGSINFPGGAKIPLPGGFELPTTGPWSYLLDIPEVRLCRHLH